MSAVAVETEQAVPDLGNGKLPAHEVTMIHTEGDAIDPTDALNHIFAEADADGVIYEVQRSRNGQPDRITFRRNHGNVENFGLKLSVGAL